MALFLSLLALLWLGGAIHVAAGALVLAVERQRPPDRSAQAVARFFREASALFLNTALSPFGLIEPSPRFTGGGPPQRPPVLLVPGYGRNRACMSFLVLALRARGWSHVWAVNNTPAKGSIPAMAQSLGDRVERMLRASGAERVDLVCHSMGGVVATWYINHLGGEQRVRRLVTIATPWRGTRLAALAPRLSGRQLVPGSEILERLGPPAVPTTAIRSDTDTVVIPPENACLEAPNVALLTLTGLGHEQLLFSPQVVALVAERLAAGEGAA